MNRPHTVPQGGRPRQGPRPPSPKNNKKKTGLILGIGIGAVVLLGLVLGIVINSQKSGYRPGGAPPGPPYVVALDAGHGGSDLGAVGLVEEVALNEATVNNLLAFLESDPNFEPVLCRQMGKGASINERARKANAAGAVLLLSVHGNSDASGTGRGFECYPAPPGRDWHEESMRFAGLLAGQMSAAGSLLRGEGGVRFAYYETNTEDESLKIFREASDTTVYDLPSFGIVERPNCPAVLAEQCFVTNAEDVQAFATAEGCYKAALCYYRAICEYFGTQPAV